MFVLQRCPLNFMAHSKQFERAFAYQIIMLAPLAPHFASELWSGLVSAEGRVDCESNAIDWDKNVLEQNWPIVDANYELSLLCKVSKAMVCKIEIFRSFSESLLY